MTTENNAAFQYNPDENYDEATIKQQTDIEKTIASSQPLIGGKEDLSVLLKEFAEDEVYVSKIKHLQKKYKHFRRTRGDGNCFYRAFGFAYIEQLLQDKEELGRFRTLIERSKDDLVSLGFQSFTIEDFHDVFLEVLDKVGNGCGLSGLIETFNDQCYSDYLVVYFRLLVSGHMQKEAEFYENFVDGGRTIKEFCQQEVEPMSRESDHIHISSLTQSTGVPVRIVYLDRSGGGSGADEPTANHHDFPEDSSPPPRICLIYRPGHYDILYA